jgi:hypothetical protein
MKNTKATKDALAPYRQRRNGGRVRRFEATLPVIKISGPTQAALRSTARALGVPVADVVREALSDYLSVPASAGMAT